MTEFAAQPALSFRLPLLLALAGLLPACAWQFPFGQHPEVVPPALTTRTPTQTDRLLLGEGDNVVGQLAAVRVRPGDTLPDIARHFGLGYEDIAAANPGLDAWAPEAGQRALLPLQFVLPDAPRQGIVVNLAAMRLFYFAKKGEVLTYPVGIGKEGRSTPTGDMRVERKAEKPIWYVPDSIRRDHERRGDPLPAAVSPGPDNPLGDYAMYLSRASYLIHGTNKPYAIGLRASNGCLRLYPEHIAALYRATPVKTPVKIVNQPYLVGQWHGQLYLEAHAPHEELNAKALKKNLLTKLKALEKQRGISLDWPKIDAIVSEARGIPVPVAPRTESAETLARRAEEWDAPAKLYGRPESPPPVTREAWYVQALETDDELTARRAAAILNHLGPQVPAQAQALVGGRYRVLAGPFKDAKTSQAVVRRLWADMELRATPLPPNERLTAR